MDHDLGDSVFRFHEYNLWCLIFAFGVLAFGWGFLDEGVSSCIRMGGKRKKSART